MNAIAVTGITGRMGKSVIAILEPSDTTHVISIDRDCAIPASADVLIDFTLPDASINYARQCAALGVNMVIGTTGFTAEQLKQIDQFSRTIGICMAANFSIGVNLTFQLLKQAVAALADDPVDIEIIEAHHRNKVDAPSGTALAMGDVIAQTLNRNLDECAIYGRQGNSDIRDQQTIGFSAIRAGDIIGEHTVLFGMQGERIEITHKASTRDNFARGAVRAANWLLNKPAGKYSMQDVLNS